MAVMGWGPEVVKVVVQAANPPVTGRVSHPGIEAPLSVKVMVPPVVLGSTTAYGTTAATPTAALGLTPTATVDALGGT